MTATALPRAWGLDSRASSAFPGATRVTHRHVSRPFPLSYSMGPFYNRNRTA